MQLAIPGEQETMEGETKEGDGIRTEADKGGTNYFKVIHNGYINMEATKTRKRMVKIHLQTRAPEKGLEFKICG